MPRSVQEHSSDTSQPQSNFTLGQAVASYVAALPQEDRHAIALDLNAFTRWFGPQRTIGSITAPDLDRYQEQLEESRNDFSSRLEALKTFLSEAKRQKWIATNLATQVRVKRKKGATRAKSASVKENQEDVVRLTRDGYDKLAEELRFLETEMRVRIALELKTAAADKDFRENAPYDVAKNHQGEVEARIRELQRILGNGQVMGINKTDKIDLGSTVTLRDLAEDEEIVYTLVGPGEIDPKRGKISIQSPVGRALAGRAVQEEVEVEVPAGKVRLRVEKITNG